jgi:DNA-binding CsgD family transcriptional regulator
MEPLRSRELRAFSSALEELYRPVSLEEFPRQVFAVVAKLLPDVVMTFDEVCNETGAVRDCASFKTPADFGELLNETLERDHPGVQYIRKGGTEYVLPLWEFTTKRQFRETQFWRELFHPLGLADQVAVIVPSTGSVAGLAVNRGCVFSQREVGILRLLAPHLRQAYETARRFAELSGNRDRFESFEPSRLLRFQLTVREAEVLHWLVEGKRDREIATILRISARTIEKHVSSILRKLGVETRSGAVRQATSFCPC